LKQIAELERELREFKNQEKKRILYEYLKNKEKNKKQVK
jgi:hypothetical protein